MERPERETCDSIDLDVVRFEIDKDNVEVRLPVGGEFQQVANYVHRFQRHLGGLLAQAALRLPVSQAAKKK